MRERDIPELPRYSCLGSVVLTQKEAKRLNDIRREFWKDMWMNLATSDDEQESLGQARFRGDLLLEAHQIIKRTRGLCGNRNEWSNFVASLEEVVSAKRAERYMQIASNRNLVKDAKSYTHARKILKRKFE